MGYSSCVIFILFNFFKRNSSKGLFSAVDIDVSLRRTLANLVCLLAYFSKTYQGRFSNLFEYET